MSFKEYNELNPPDDVPTVDLDTGDVRRAELPANKRESYKKLLEWSENERGAKFPPASVLKQYKAFKIASQGKFSAADLKRRWIEMADDKFWQDKGFDWMTVVNSFARKPPIK